ncbi:MAG: hypothetical protein KKF46_04800 [Nanoarchaeota archaeon]|nr:hypothetical protein [Nanoarchaeota archaeon]MBU1321651.1 hypothetical protein [Nanoarchaeota archaeon]MBU1597592.1 hypothetical protein [Nanoarchaeota archaeon]MBU2441688.1 hypothetical protein [Nanoarchaeota archaeon]
MKELELKAINSLMEFFKERSEDKLKEPDLIKKAKKIWKSAPCFSLIRKDISEIYKIVRDFYVPKSEAKKILSKLKKIRLDVINGKVKERIIREILLEELLKFAKKYDKGEIDDENALKELNSVVFHNGSFQPFIFELFFEVALENNIIIKSPFLLSPLFGYLDDDLFLEPETFSYEGTRMKVLKALDLKESQKLYNDYLVELADEKHGSTKYFSEKVDIHMVRESVLKEAKEKFNTK